MSRQVCAPAECHWSGAQVLLKCSFIHPNETNNTWPTCDSWKVTMRTHVNVNINIWFRTCWAWESSAQDTTVCSIFSSFVIIWIRQSHGGDVGHLGEDPCGWRSKQQCWALLRASVWSQQQQQPLLNTEEEPRPPSWRCSPQPGACCRSQVIKQTQSSCYGHWLKATRTCFLLGECSFCCVLLDLCPIFKMLLESIPR